jgi:large subunit ribosomal protein L13
VNKSYSAKVSEIKRDWHVIDANDQVLGRLTTQIARLLMGKHKPMYTPNLDTGDFVVVVNASKIRVTGKKMTDKIYHHHTPYPGGLKSTNFATMQAKHPERVIELAVRGMLPHTKLGNAMRKKLKVYAGAEHPHAAQVNGSTTVAVGNDGEANKNTARKPKAAKAQEATAKKE